MEKIKVEIPEDFYGVRATNSFYDAYKEEECYKLRGVRPVYDKVDDKERESY